MIYWIQEAALAGAQEAASSLPSAILSGGVVGAVVALVGLIFAQLRHTQTLRQTRELEDKRARETRELEAQRADEAALQKYFEQVGKLLIEHPDNASLGTVARAQTLAVLEGLDPDRKRILLQFLYESNLIEAESPAISLLGANLRKANLGGANLERANQLGANLEEAYLEETNLEKANLVGAEGLTQQQLNKAFGSESTKLPDHLQRPAHWSKGDEGPSKRAEGI